AADRDVGEVDAELGEPVGEPRPVAVAHAPAEHLGARHHDARAGAHPIVPAGPVPGPVVVPVVQGRCPGGSALCLVGLMSYPTDAGPGGMRIRLPFTLTFTELRPRLMRRRLPRKILTLAI